MTRSVGRRLTRKQRLRRKLERDRAHKAFMRRGEVLDVTAEHEEPTAEHVAEEQAKPKESPRERHLREQIQREADRIAARRAEHDLPAGKQWAMVEACIGRTGELCEKLRLAEIPHFRPRDEIERRLASGQVRKIRVALFERMIFVGLEHQDQLEALAVEGYERFVDTLKQRAKHRAAVRGQKFNSTLTPADGGILLPTPQSSTIIGFLRPEATFLQGGPKRVPPVSGQFNQPRGATSATAGYVGEGAKKPVGSPTFNNISMRSTSATIPSTATTSSASSLPRRSPATMSRRPTRRTRSSGPSSRAAAQSRTAAAAP